MSEFDLFVLGTGPAASRVALRCADHEWKVGIVDNRPYGGTCALRGCNPKKVLVRAAELMDWIARAEGNGVRTKDAHIDWAELMRFKRTFTAPETDAKNEMFEEAGITRYRGETRFLGPNTLEVAGEEIAARKSVVATGARPRPLDLPGAELIASSDTFLDLDELPRRILFLGGGYISFEFAHVAAWAGAEVTIVEVQDRVLAGFDADLVDTLVDRTRQLGIDVRTSAKPARIDRRDDRSLSVLIETESGEETLEADLVVHGAGRIPNVDALNLEKGEVRYGGDGIEVNEFLQSVSNEDVYAAGDVASTDSAMLSPTAALEGRTVAKNLLEGNFHQPDYGTVDSLFMKNRAAALASAVAGVFSVQNRLKLDDSFPEKVDEEIRKDIEDQLFWSPFVDSDDVTVSVNSGVATLFGTVEDWDEAQAARENAREGGATSVISKLNIRNGFGS